MDARIVASERRRYTPSSQPQAATPMSPSGIRMNAVARTVRSVVRHGARASSPAAREGSGSRSLRTTWSSAMIRSIRSSSPLLPSLS